MAVPAISSIFKRTRVSLTATYLGIIMLLSLAFSWVVWQLSMENWSHDFGRQKEYLERQLPNSPVIDRLLAQRLKQIEDDELRLIGSLLIMNVMILGLGGLVSYLLALRALEPIEKAHLAQKRFTADASHELRTPLAVIQAENEVTLMNPKLTLKDAKLQLQSNIDEVGRLTALSESLLHLAQAEKNTLQVQSVPLSKVIDTAWNSVKKEAKKKHIPLLRESKEQESVLVTVDQSALGEALSNIFENAIKYSPNEAKITVTVSREGSMAVLQIADNGPGIAADALPRIFDRFYRADSSRTTDGGKMKGYGLGLSIAKNLIELQGGRVDVRSQEGKGTEFFVTIPRASE